MTSEELERESGYQQHFIDDERLRWNVAPMRKILSAELQSMIREKRAKLEFVTEEDLKHLQGTIAGIKTALTIVEKTNK